MIIKKNTLNHLAIIMDGNGRWANNRGLDRSEGHSQGAIVLANIASHCKKIGIKYLTLYAFSSENWLRPKSEVDSLMQLLEQYLESNTQEFIKQGVKIITIGNIAKLNNNLQNKIKYLIDKTKNLKNFTIILALSYGSQDEIAYACKNIVHKALSNEITLEQIDKNLFATNLETNNLPNPDLLIRTSGELRLSNFLLFQLSYSELYFAKTLWPDFTRYDLDCAIEEYYKRVRRFGKTKEV